MKIILKRLFQKGEIIEGQLFIEGIHVCDTLENDRNRLPPGEYEVEVGKCSFHSRKMPLVIADPSRPAPPCSKCFNPGFVGINATPKRSAKGMRTVYCPQITMGNGAHKRHDGSILVGRKGGLGLLLHPRMVFDSLYERIRKGTSRGRKVTLVVEKHYFFS